MQFIFSRKMLQLEYIINLRKILYVTNDCQCNSMSPLSFFPSSLLCTITRRHRVYVLLVQHLCKCTNTNLEHFRNEPLEMNAVNFASRQTIELRNTMFFSIKENQIYIPVFLLVYIQALSIIPSENRSCLQMQFLQRDAQVFVTQYKSTT